MGILLSFFFQNEHRTQIGVRIINYISAKQYKWHEYKTAPQMTNYFHERQHVKIFFTVLPIRLALDSAFCYFCHDLSWVTPHNHQFKI